MTAGIEIIKDNFVPWSKIAVSYLLSSWLKIRLNKLIKNFDELETNRSRRTVLITKSELKNTIKIVKTIQHRGFLSKRARKKM